MKCRNFLNLGVLAGLLAFSGPQAAAQVFMPDVLSMEQRASVMDGWLESRLDNLVPSLMRRADIDMWVLVAREYNEDPVVHTMLPATWLSARRRTILVFFDNGASVERLAVARYNIGSFFEKAWDPETQPDQWKRLAEIITERDPKKIALNYSSDFALADGITLTQHQELVKSLPTKYAGRVVSGEKLAIGWLETRSNEEMETYPIIMRIAHEIIAEGLSESTIQPGVTTTEDLAWWYRDRIRELGLVTWFHPGIDIQREREPVSDGDFSSRSDASIIQAGDIVWVDFGITYLGLNTDTQQMAYVLKPGETGPPSGLANALATGNMLQDILTKQFVEGRSGNQILLGALEEAEQKGIKATIYTHPIGFHGHAAGPTIGLWDQQGGVPGRGDYPLYANTAHSIELNARVTLPEWKGQEILIKLEEDAFFDGQETWYIDGRQQQFWVIPRDPVAGVRATIETMLGLIGAGNWNDLYSKFADPDDVYQARKAGEVSQRAEFLASGPGYSLGDFLLKTREMQPTILSEGRVVEFPFPGTQQNSMQFEKIGARWYLRN